MSRFREALRLLPEFADAHNNLGTAFIEQGEFEEAANQFQTALRLRPDFASAQQNLARHLLLENWTNTPRDSDH